MKPTNCPNCGAPLKGGKCEYCGTEITPTTSANEISNYLNGEYKQTIISIETAMKHGVLEPMNGLKMIAELRSRKKNLEKSSTFLLTIQKFCLSLQRKSAYNSNW